MPKKHDKVKRSVWFERCELRRAQKLADKHTDSNQSVVIRKALALGLKRIAENPHLLVEA